MSKKTDAPIVIIGTGLAGYTTARELRKLDSEVPLEIITSDDGHFYSKPMISNALGRGQEPLDLPTGDAVKMAADLDARVRTRTRVDAIDKDAKRLSLNGDTLEYSQLVLGLGADPVRLDLAGEAHTALSVNDLDDYSAFRNAIAARGLTFHPQIVDEQRFRLEVNHYDHGNGVAVADVDGDGKLDVYFVSQVGPNGLFQNLGQGKFQNITEQAGVALADRLLIHPRLEPFQFLFLGREAPGIQVQVELIVVNDELLEP